MALVSECLRLLVQAFLKVPALAAQVSDARKSRLFLVASLWLWWVLCGLTILAVKRFHSEPGAEQL